jgi:hypothetical protein
VPRAGSRPVWNLRRDPLRSLASSLGGQERLRNVPIERDCASVFCGRGPILGLDLLVHGDKSVMIVAINPSPIAAAAAFALRASAADGHCAFAGSPPQGGA